jgi:acyl-CoA thioester hydrolase
MAVRLTRSAAADTMRGSGAPGSCDMPSAATPPYWIMTSSEISRPHRTALRVRYAETDQMGVVYHANYLVWCEVGRTEFLRSAGTSYADLERRGVTLAVAEASLRFHASATYDDRILVETSVSEVRSRAIAFAYVISRASEGESLERLVTARTSLIALDTNGHPRKLPDAISALFSDVEARAGT